MGKVGFARLAAAALLGCSAAALAGPPVSLPTVPNYSRVFSADDSGTLSRSGGLLNDWRFRSDRLSELGLSYDSALRFAQCVARFDREAPETVLSNAIGDSDSRLGLIKLAAKNRGCVQEAGTIPPLLLRAAFAELALKAPESAAATWPVGVPTVVDGYPLGRVSRCQVAVAPDRVKLLLSTRPGGVEERQVADQLYRTLPQCGTSAGLGGIEATAARLALLDAMVIEVSERR